MWHSESLTKTALAKGLYVRVCVEQQCHREKLNLTTGILFRSSSDLLPWIKFLVAAGVHLLAQFPPEGSCMDP